MQCEICQAYVAATLCFLAMAAVGRVAWRRYSRWKLHASLLDKINDDYERKGVMQHYIRRTIKWCTSI